MNQGSQAGNPSRNPLTIDLSCPRMIREGSRANLGKCSLKPQYGPGGVQLFDYGFCDQHYCNDCPLNYHNITEQEFLRRTAPRLTKPSILKTI